MLNKLIPAAAIASLLLCNAAHAATYDFQLTGTVAFAQIAGTSVGQTFTLDVFANNGGSTSIGQTWTTANVTSTVLNIGSGAYTQTYSGAPYNGAYNFSLATDGSGAVSNVHWAGTGFTAPEITGVYAAGNSIFTPLAFLQVYDSLGNHNQITYSGNWSVVNGSTGPSPTPLPASLPLFASAIVALMVFFGIRNKRKSGSLATA